MKKLVLFILFLVVLVGAFLVWHVTKPIPVVVTLSENQKLQNGKPFRFIGPNRQHPVVKTIMLGFMDACKDLQVDCVDNNFDGVDFSLFTPAVDLAIAQGTSGCVGFVDKAVLEADKKLVGAGIPVMAVHSRVDPEMVSGILGWVGADATDYAQRAAVVMGDKLEGKGVVAITQGNLNDLENLVSEVFTATMQEKYPNIKVLKPEMEGFDTPAAISIVSTILQANPKITGVFGTTGNSATVWAKAAEQAGKKPGEIIIVGMDYVRSNLDLVKSGQVYALIGQPLYEEGYRVAELLTNNLNGRTVLYDNIYPAPIIFAKDLDKYYEYADRVDASLK